MAAAGNQPDFIRYYLQFPAVTRTLVLTIVVVSISLQLNLISRYSLYGSFWGSFLRFFDAGWGMWFLMTVFMCIVPIWHTNLIVVYQQSSQVESFFSTADYSWMLLMTGAVIMVSPLSPSAFLFRFRFVFFYLRSSFCLATVFALLVVGSGEGADQGHSYRRATNENKCSVHFQCAHEWYGRLHSIPITYTLFILFILFI